MLIAMDPRCSSERPRAAARALAWRDPLATSRLIAVSQFGVW
jgi:hypothetical protein